MTSDLSNIDKGLLDILKTFKINSIKLHSQSGGSTFLHSLQHANAVFKREQVQPAEAVLSQYFLKKTTAPGDSATAYNTYQDHEQISRYFHYSSAHNKVKDSIERDKRKLMIEHTQLKGGIVNKSSKHCLSCLCMVETMVLARPFENMFI